MKEDDDLGDSVTQISLKALESQKRKQRNKKHKKKKPINNKSSEDNLEDDVEKSVREVNRILGKNFQFLSSHVQFFRVILDPLPPLKVDIVNF